MTNASSSRKTLFNTSGFTLLELLVVIAILALLISVLLPALSAARAEGTKAKCLANLSAIGQGFIAYSVDDVSGFTAPVHQAAETFWRWEGEYEYGGHSGIGVYGDQGTPLLDLREENRPLNRYLFGDTQNTAWAMYQCPTDSGISSAPYDFDDYFTVEPETFGKKVHEVTGSSYRLNNQIDFTQQTSFDTHFYGPYLRPTTHIPSPSTTIILAEAISEVAKWNAPNYRTMGWHRKANSFNVAFCDGHVDVIHLAGQADWVAESQAKNYWLLRGPNWRMDCYPKPRICDKPQTCFP